MNGKDSKDASVTLKAILAKLKRGISSIKLYPHRNHADISRNTRK
jgi:hypothetical protein